MLSAAAGSMLAAQQQPTFRGSTETVAIYATVLDRYGVMALDLKRDDFEVFDDGRRQELTTFETGLQPINAVLLLDASASMTLNLELAGNAAEQFVIRMLPGDKARFGSFSDRLQLNDELTGDRDVLLRAVRDGVKMGNPTTLWDAVDEAITALAPLDGRRVLVLLTDGMDTMSKLTEEDVFSRVRTDELMIYVVQFRSSARANLAEFPLSAPPSTVLAGTRGPNRSPTEMLRRLARQTGGGHFVLGQYDDVNATFTSVMQELHYQYILGFTPQRLDGRVHDLDVRVNKPEHTVRARQTYLAPRSNARQAP